MRLPKYSLIYSIGGPHPGIRSARLPRTPFLFWKGLENARTTPRTTPPLQCNHTSVSLFLVFRRCLSLPPPFIYFIHNSRAKTIILLISLLVHVFSLYGYFFFLRLSSRCSQFYMQMLSIYTPPHAISLRCTANTAARLFPSTAKAPSLATRPPPPRQWTRRGANPAKLSEWVDRPIFGTLIDAFL